MLASFESNQMLDDPPSKLHAGSEPQPILALLFVVGNELEWFYPNKTHKSMQLSCQKR